MSESPSSGLLLICLVGGRPQPAALTAFVLDAAVVVAIPSSSTPHVANELRDVVMSRNDAVETIACDAVDPMDSDACCEAVLKVAADYPELKPRISLGGAPMPMVIGGYRAAQELHCSAGYLDTNGGFLLDLAGRGPATKVKINFPLDDVLMSYGFTLPPHKDISQSRLLSDAQLRVATAMAQNIKVTRDILDWLRGEPNDKTKKSRRGNRKENGKVEQNQITNLVQPAQRVWKLRREHFDLLQNMQADGFLSGIPEAMPIPGHPLTLRIPTKVEAKFLNGDWLEMWIYSRLRKMVGGEAQILDDAGHNVEVIKDDVSREIDCVAVRHGIPMIISAKSRKEFPLRADVEELNTVAKMLGDNYCTRILVTTWLPPEGGTLSEGIRKVKANAKEVRVVIITGDEIADADTWLRRELLQKPTFSPR